MTDRLLWRRTAGLALALALIVVLAAASLVLGARSLTIADAINAIVFFNGSDEQRVVRLLRLPRTALAIVVGAALGLAGALIQGVTRNPLADPGLLGINAGAAFAVAVSISVFGLGGIHEFIWPALLGAALGAAIVYGLGSSSGVATPVRLIIAGVAVAAMLGGATTFLTLLAPTAFNSFRYWNIGGLGSADASVLRATLPFMLVGSLIGLLLGKPLNALALGDESARALGAGLGRTRLLGMVAITLLCGASTAAAGPIGFVGLVAPHVALLLAGPDQRWVLLLSALLGPILLLGSDIVGRLVVRPDELQAGLVTAFIGAPVLITLVRRSRALRS